MLDKEQIENWEEEREVQLEMDFEGMRGDERDKTPMQMVQEYVRVSKQKPDRSMSERLIFEESDEWMEELNGSDGAAELKELSDLVYVIYGYANVRGWDLDMAVLRVHDNNMGRMNQPDGTIQWRDDGKVLKNKAYPKVDLGDLI